jgi:hypothetical protein
MGSEDCTVQSETMPALSRGETLGKDPGQVLWWNSDACVRDFNLLPVWANGLDREIPR